MNRTTRLMTTLLLGGLTLLLATSASAAVQDKTLCVFDPSGANGDVYKLTQTYQSEALAWGVKFRLKAYTDENIAANDFRTKQCDAVLTTGLPVRKWVKTSSTVEAIGALRDYNQLKSVLKVLHKERAKKLVTSGEYETAGIFPGGAAYLLLRDRKNNSMQKLAGKKITALRNDKAATTMVGVAAMAVVPADISTFAGKFNNGQADACYAPAAAIEPLELKKGLSHGGGIVRFPLGQLTYQITIRTKEFPEGFGQKSRDWSSKQFNTTLKVAKNAEAKLGKSLWVDVPEDKRESYFEVMRQTRSKLRKKGVYSRSVLKLMYKVRCRSNKTAAECAEGFKE